MQCHVDRKELCDRTVGCWGSDTENDGAVEGAKGGSDGRVGGDVTESRTGAFGAREGQGLKKKKQKKENEKTRGRSKACMKRLGRTIPPKSNSNSSVSIQSIVPSARTAA